MKVLVVEDNLEIAQNICEYLQLQNHIVDCTQNGLHALELLQEQSFDAIILTDLYCRLHSLRQLDRLTLIKCVWLQLL